MSTTSSDDTYYRDHWVDIDSGRLNAYESMFDWHPRMAPLLEGAALTPGLEVMDFGCGPGGLSVEMARRVGPGGRVHGIDLNADMVARAEARAARECVSDCTRFACVTGDRLPFDDGALDRAVCKSVLEYVTDPGATLAEFRRVTRPGGLVHVVDSDWAMLVVEPLDETTLAELFAAASHAYHTPRIGRQLYGLFRAAGFVDVQVRVLSAADTSGMRVPIVRHMVGYARDGGRMDLARADAILASVEQALEDGTYLLVLPQFIVTGVVPGAS